jgi:hypothetical protein
MQETTMRVSIIINTYNREPLLRRLLPGFKHLRGVPFEVIVVNGPSTDTTSRLLDEYKGQVKVIDCPSRNLSHSRNLGIAVAAGEVIVYIDDDAWPSDPDWLLRYVQVFASDATVGAAGGPVWHRDTNLMEFNGGATSDYGFQLFDLNQQGDLVIDGQRWVYRSQGCNCAFRRESLVNIGGFDQFFTYYHDETDVCLRLARHNYTYKHLPDNYVRHYSAGSERRLNKYDRNWDIITRSDTYFAMKNGADPLPIRLWKTIKGALHKHYIQEIIGWWRKEEITTPHWLRLMRQCARGFASGLWAGVFKKRPMGDFIHAPPHFLPFPTLNDKDRLRIALVTQSIPGQSGNGGIGRYTFDLATGLHELGHEVHLICRSEVPIRYQSLGFYVHGINDADSAVENPMIGRPILSKNIGFSQSVTRKLLELRLSGFNFDVVHGSNWDSELAALVRSGFYPTVMMLVSSLAQVVLTENWELTDDLKSCIDLDRWQIENADTICVPSFGVLSSYEKLMGVNSGSLNHLYKTPLGIVPQPFTSILRAEGANQRLLFVGRCEKRKGVHHLLEVLPSLLETYPHWECHLVGNYQVPTAEGQTMRETFLLKHQDAPWLARVIFHGIVDDETLQQHYRGCDLFVAPSLFESFGLIYHEAMQYGKAVVGCRTGGVPEVVQDGIEGILVEPDNPVDLLKALSKLMGDEELRQKMGLAGFKRIKDEMNYRVMANSLEQVYRDTISRTGCLYSKNRERLLPNDLPILESPPELQFSGSWAVQEAHPGHVYRLGRAGASISFEARGASLIQITALRHPWSGVLELQTVSGFAVESKQYVDLYKPDPMELDYGVSFRLPGTPDSRVKAILRVHEERNPASQASEIWIKRLAASVYLPVTFS